MLVSDLSAQAPPFGMQVERHQGVDLLRLMLTVVEQRALRTALRPPAPRARGHRCVHDARNPLIRHVLGCVTAPLVCVLVPACIEHRGCASDADAGCREQG